MIKLSYMLVRDEKDETKTYLLKDYPPEFSNLTYIEGPNGSGKSAILHIIALALYGNRLEKDELDPGLHKRISSLVDDPQNKLTFELEIDVPENGLKLVSRKTNPNSKDIDLRLIQNGKEIPYPFEKFKNEFRLIYTIPNNPTRQLPELLLELKAAQSETTSKVSWFRGFLEKKIQDLENSRDEKNLNSEKETKKIAEERYSEIDWEHRSLSKKHEKLRSYYNLNGYLENTSKVANLQDELDKLVKEIQIANKSTVRKCKDNRSSIQKFNQIMSNIEREKTNLTFTLSKYKHSNLPKHLALINSSSVVIEIKNSDKQKTIRDSLIACINGIQSLATSEENIHKEDLLSLELYSSLLRILKNPNYSQITVPGTNSNVGLLMTQIEDAIEEKNSIQRRIKSYDSDAESVKKFLQNVENAISIYNNTDLSPDSRGMSEQEIQLASLKAKETELNRRLKLAKNERGNFKTGLISQKIDPTVATIEITKLEKAPEIQDFIKLSVQEQQVLIEKNERELRDLDSQRIELSKFINSKKKNIENLEKQEFDPDREYIADLKVFSRHLVTIESLFRSKLPEALKRIENKKMDSSSELDIKYSVLIGDYYAKKMKTILYGEKEFTVSNVDIVKEVIKTAEGKEIKFDYLGTGQSQSSYLITKLGMTDAKKTIALFDEVAMMDNKSLKPVIEVLKTNYKNGKLIAAIIVQRGEMPKVEEL